MFGVPDYGAFLLGAILIILLPGPNSLFVLTTAATGSVRRAYVAAAGVFVSDSILMIASVGGVSSVLQHHPALFMVVKYAGAAYLAWLGLRLAVNGLRAVAPTVVTPPSAEPMTTRAHEVPDEVEPAVGSDENLATARRQRNPFFGALVLGLLNPKAILFFVAFFVQFMDPASPHPVLSFLVLAGTLQVVSLIYLTCLIFGGSYLAERFRRHRRLAGAGTAGVGLVFLGFGAKLATASLG